MKNKRFFRVGIEIPDGSSVRAVENYIRDAVWIYKGSLSPDDPLFDIRTASISVVPLPKKKEVENEREDD